MLLLGLLGSHRCCSDEFCTGFQLEIFTNKPLLWTKLKKKKKKKKAKISEDSAIPCHWALFPCCGNEKNTRTLLQGKAICESDKRQLV